MAEFTKEQLIEKLERRLAVTTHYPDFEEAQLDAQIFKIALEALTAGMEQEPVAWLLSGGGAKNNVSFDSGNAYADPLREVTPLYTAPPAPVSVPAAMEIDDDFDSAFEHGKAVGWNAYRAAMLQAEPVTTAYRLPFEQWLSQQTGTIDVECGCVMTEVFFHWMRVAYEAGNSPVAPDCSANILRRWLAFGRAMQSSGSQLPRHLIAETESMLAAAPQQEVK
ncbi:hypothetical protein [Escherichia coli]|uniref:hypothetical protein n=1 Tax=Escherichia coli TaxID=562 RepID=UPI003C2BC0D7